MEKSKAALIGNIDEDKQPKEDTQMQINEECKRSNISYPHEVSVCKENYKQ